VSPAQRQEIKPKSVRVEPYPGCKPRLPWIKISGGFKVNRTIAKGKDRFGNAMRLANLSYGYQVQPKIDGRWNSRMFSVIIDRESAIAKFKKITHK